MIEEPKKTKWVPKPNSRHLTKWHIHSYHKGAPAQPKVGVALVLLRLKRCITRCMLMAHSKKAKSISTGSLSDRFVAKLI